MFADQSFLLVMTISAQAHASLCLGGMLWTPKRQAFLACAHSFPIAVAPAAADSRVLFRVDLATMMTLASVETRGADFQLRSFQLQFPQMLHSFLRASFLVSASLGKNFPKHFLQYPRWPDCAFALALPLGLQLPLHQPYKGALLVVVVVLAQPISARPLRTTKERPPVGMVELVVVPNRSSPQSKEETLSGHPRRMVELLRVPDTDASESSWTAEVGNSNPLSDKYESSWLKTTSYTPICHRQRVRTDEHRVNFDKKCWHMTSCDFE